MKVWAKVLLNHKIQRDVVQEFSPARPSDLSGWTEVITALCKPLDLAVPVLLPKHLSELNKFSRTVFKPGDFLEAVAFDAFEMEVFPEKKKESRQTFLYG